jgi:hypothetical protein
MTLAGEAVRRHAEVGAPTRGGIDDAGRAQHYRRTIMHIENAAIVAALRARGLPERAAWVARQLPSSVDTARNASLLRRLGIDPEAVTQQQAGQKTTLTKASVPA